MTMASVTDSEVRETGRTSLPWPWRLLAYARWWVRYANGLTVVRVVIFGVGSLYYMPSVVMEGRWTSFAALALLLGSSVLTVSWPALRWRYDRRRRAEGRTGRHASEVPPWL